jgi:TPR repeat protein
LIVFCALLAFLLYEVVIFSGEKNQKEETVFDDKKNHQITEMMQYLKESKLPVDYDSLMKLALRGNSDAQYAIGAMLDMGIEVEVDEMFAQKWFALAFQGYHYKAIRNIADSISMYKVGDMLFWGIGIPENKSEAAFWYQRAARLRNRNAMFALSKMLQEGIGIGVDEQESLKLYMQAILQ